MAAVHVIRPGLQTTIQDEGRWGWQARGVSVSGAMDPRAYRISNALVGNDTGLAALEITLVGPELEFEDPRVVAVTGAEFVVTLDGQPAPANAAFLVLAGSRLRFSERRRGARAYLAVAGGIAVPSVLGSRSTHLMSRMGGFKGRALAAGDRVPLGDPPIARTSQSGVRLQPDHAEIRLKPDPTWTPAGGVARVRVLPDRHTDRFEDHALDALQSGPYRVGHMSDRMGFRLEGPVLRHSRGADIVSDATPLGTLQVPASGQPILLMADRPATGGYTRIASVISADISVAAQLGPGDAVAFERCTLAEARAARVASERALMTIEDRARA